MRFTTAALACNAVCLGFATGFAKPPSQGVSRQSPKSATVGIGGPLRGLVQGAERAAQDEARRAGGRRFLAVLHGVRDGSVGGQASDASSDKVRARGIECRLGIGCCLCLMLTPVFAKRHHVIL